MARLSYSSEGEDILVLKLFERMFAKELGHHGVGTYVDVGAFHPTINSNTAALFDMGWHGVNIDPRPGSMLAFELARPFDLNRQVAVGAVYSKGLYRVFNRPELNGIMDADGVRFREARGAHIVNTHEVSIRPLNDILQGVSAVDFLSVDVEGMELEVLQSLDWEEHRPCVVAVEDCGVGMDIREMAEVGDPSGSACTTFLDRHGYALHSRLDCSLIFVDTTRAEKR